MESIKTKEISELQTIGGIPFPVWLETKRLVITGPPGCGKSTVTEAIGGWLEEACLNLSIREWWKSPLMAHRPRELHFSLPFVGFSEAVPVYATKTLDDAGYLELDLLRIPLPPAPRHFLSTDFRNRFVFEFILPPAETVFELRRQRARSGTHHVDEHLTLATVQEERDFYQQLALFFHQGGMNVYIREELNGNPRVITETADREAPAQDEDDDEIDRHLDQLRLRERLLNRSWSLRGNKKLIDLLVEMVPNTLGVERCSIFINDPSAGRVWLQAGTDIKENQIQMSHHDSLVGQVITSGKYLVMEEMDQLNGPHREIDAKTGFVTRNELCVPIRSLSDRKASGAIVVLNKNDGQRFDDADRKFLERVASHLQTAIESIYLRQELMDFSVLLSHRVRYSKWVKYGLIALLMIAAAEAIIIAFLLEYPG